MRDLCIICYLDNCNRGYKTYKSLSTQGVSMYAMKSVRHPFNYDEQLPCINIEQMQKYIDNSKVVWFIMGKTKLVNKLNLKGKKVIVTYSGTKYRQNPEKHNKVFNTIADLILCLGNDSMKQGAKDPHFLTQRICDVDTMMPKYYEGGKVVIGHYPSNHKKKGTDKIVKILEEINKSYDVDVRVSTKPVNNSDNLKRMSECDIYIEQLMPTQNGVHFQDIGNQAFEAAALGCVVISNCAEPELYTNDLGELKIEVANDEEEMKNSIISILNDIDNLRARQMEVREWAEKNLSYEASGIRIKNKIEHLWQQE